MALSSDFKKSQPTEDLEEILEALERLLDRTKVMFEQYFMGIQKVAPMQLHRDVERKVRELTQQHIRNTGLRFRFTTLCQKFGAYNTYWKRTLREIEQGRYVRDLQRVKRKVEQQGEDLPEELLVKLPKRMQDRIRRDRERLARTQGGDDEQRALADRSSIMFSGSQSTVHEISEEDTLFNDADIDDLFGAIREQSQMGPLPEPDPEPEPPPPPAPPPRQVEPPRAAKLPPRPIGPIVPASVTTSMKKLSPQPGAPPPKSAGPVVPPPLRPSSPPRMIPKPAPTSPPVARPTPPVARPTPPAARPAPSDLPPGMTEKQCRELHARYAKARELVGDRSDVSYDKLLATLNKQAPAIMKEHGARAVDFQVVVRGDKVVLKAKPVK